LARAGGDSVDKIHQVRADRWKDKGTEEVDEDDESHRETAETAKVLKEDKFGQVVDSRVNPSTSLGEQNAPGVRSSRKSVRIRDELVRHSREVLRHQSGQITILTKREKILLVQRVHNTVGVVLDDFVRDDERLAFVGCT
jgi:hypothetical protein